MPTRKLPAKQKGESEKEYGERRRAFLEETAQDRESLMRARQKIDRWLK